MRPVEILLYKCPKCSYYLESDFRSSGDNKKAVWICARKDCRRKFKLSFSEVR